MSNVPLSSGSVERDNADETVSLDSINTMSRDMKAQMVEVFNTHKKICRSYKNLLRQNEQHGESTTTEQNTADGIASKPGSTRTLRKSANLSLADSSSHDFENLATEVAELKEKVAKQGQQIRELTETVRHLRSGAVDKKPNGYVKTIKSSSHIAKDDKSTKRKRDSSIESYSSSNGGSLSKKVTPSPTKLKTNTSVKGRCTKESSGKVQKYRRLSQASARSPDKRDSFRAAMSTTMVNSGESESDESYQLPKNAVSDDLSEDEKNESGSDTATEVSVKKGRSRSMSPEVEARPSRVVSSVIPASQNGNSNYSRLAVTRRSTRNSDGHPK